MDLFRSILLIVAAVGVGLIIFGAVASVRWPHVQHGSSTSVKIFGLELSAGGALGMVVLGVVLIIIALFSWNNGPGDVPTSVPDSTHPPNPPVASPATPTSASPAPRTPNEPPPAPTKGTISPQVAAAQIGVWESVASHEDAVVNAYNSLDLALVHWETKTETVWTRDALAKGVRDAAENLVSAGQPLDKIRKEYPQLQDFAAVLSNSPADRVKQAAADFADALAQNGQETNEDRVVRLRPFAGALRVEMGAMDNWMTDLGRTAEPAGPRPLRGQVVEYPCSST